MDDSDVWLFAHVDDLWIFDKLILSKKLNYDCGPAGVLPSKDGKYIVRPCVNYRMMGKGAQIMHLNTLDDVIPDGHFWCEYFEGRHLSFDYHYGKQVLAVEGFRNKDDVNQFFCWKKVNDTYQLPDFLEKISHRYEWLNIEVIENKVIEVHLRYNDDFYYHSGSTIIPVWKGEEINMNLNFHHSPCQDKLGFYVFD